MGLNLAIIFLLVVVWVPTIVPPPSCWCTSATTTDSAMARPTPHRRPDWRDKAATARWMVHTLDYGVLSTVSSRFVGDENNMVPFGNVYSFVDGSNATGTPYFYGTFLDQSLADMKLNPSASFTLTEASLPCSSDDENIRQACSIYHYHPSPSSSIQRNEEEDGAPRGTQQQQQQPGDPENPVCARLTLIGMLVQVPRESPEFTWIQTNFWDRHPQMRDWPVDHDWVIVKLVLQHIWLIDYYGGATVLDPDTYYNGTTPPLAWTRMT